ncbi:MAG: rod shape-determining protein MreD [Clostridiales bacterium]|nr:rod shape-determining protein MreD [Clostridiales bacterium]
MRKWLVVLSLVIAFYLDTVFFNMLNLYGIRPDLTLAVIVSLGVLAGSGPAAAAGFITGLIADVLFNKIVGLTALSYMLSGFIAGFFYRKFYADNIIIPTVLLLICFFVKEHVFLFASLLAGARPNYFMTLITYILPSLLLTGGTVILVHLFFKKTLYRSLWRNEAIDVN